ncbi:hypothetical protein P280DRAFT_516939 [Massarina eburnea CBS 473.64]|uniref:Dehydrin-like protein 3 n=1 Tax=Massarina eburnea CBS 473.64 TaxID=1395130 RepID=A0A6A6S677_9PLEO|nr:hypothetical protein P280DRAFT_516939 [Massarina eburnea CBS 473.64]
MEAIKNIVSGGHRKSEDATTDSNRAAGESNVAGGRSQVEHPIYDQMKAPTSNSFGESTSTQDNPSHAQTTAPGATSGISSTQSATSSLGPDTTKHRPSPGHDEVSSASIKSGVIGYPQRSGDEHAALGNDHPAQSNLRENQVLGGGSQSTPINREENDQSHLGGITANTARGSRSGEQQPFEKSLGQSAPVSGSDRSFPLTGGVTSHHSAESTSTSAREPGTKENEIGLHDGQGREGLASAAAAATASSSIPGHRHEAARDPQPTVTSTEPTERIGPTGQGRHPDALAATTAASNTRSVPPLGQEQTQPTSGTTSNQSESGLLFTEGPHSTDTGNLFDPAKTGHLHIPGEFPSPTPMEEPSEPSYITSKGPIPVSTGAQHELRHTGTLDEPQTKHADQGAGEHHYGRDAAIAGGLGAAGAGTYAAGKHHNEPTQAGGEVFPSEKSPYSSQKIDPRIDTKPSGTSQQKFDASTTNKPQARDPTLTSGVAQPISQNQTRDEKSEHHTGRNVALGTGAGAAATTAGLYTSQRANEPDSGPASSTIGPHKSNVANALDPRVQPDPELQKHHHAASTVDDPAPKTVGPHTSDIANVMDPRVLPDPQKQTAAPKEEHHYGRNTAVAGGLGAAGAGAYAATRENEHGQQAHGTGNQYPTSGINQSVQGQQSYPSPTQQPQHHYGRDAAVAGGLGAAGAGAYATTHGNDHQQSSLGQQQSPTRPHRQSPLSQVQQSSAGGSHQRYDSAQDPKVQNQHHTRDAAALGTAGAVAGAGGAYAYSQHDAKEREAAQKAHDQQLKDQQKHFAAQQKEQDKAFHSQQKDADKAHAKEQKHHDKLAAAAVTDNKHQKEIEDREQAQQERLDRERERERERVHKSTSEEEPKGKKHHFFGFLHRDKDKKNSSPDSSPRASGENARHSKEYAAAGVGAAGVGAAAYEAGSGSDSGEGRKRLHKDPPKGHPAREVLDHQQHDNGSGDHTTRADAHGPDSHHGTVIEPHTGLPMNVEKYGDGRGGTDGSRTVEGYHQLPGMQGGEHASGQARQGGVTDWEHIRKSNTPY